MSVLTKPQKYELQRGDRTRKLDHIIEFHLDPLNLAKTVKTQGHVTKGTNESKPEYLIQLTSKDIIMVKETMRSYSNRSDNWENRTIRGDHKGPLTWIWNYEENAFDPAQFAEEYAGSDSSPIIPVFSHLPSNFVFFNKYFSQNDYFTGPDVDLIRTRNVIAYYFATLFCFFPEMPMILVSDDRSCSCFQLIATELPYDDLEEVNRRIMATEILLFFGYMAKPAITEHVMTWLNRRASAIHRGNKGLGTVLNRAQAAPKIYDYWQSVLDDRKIVVESILINTPMILPALETLTKELIKQLRMILEWSEMRLYRASYLYISTQNPALMTNASFARQALHLYKTYNKYEALHKERHPYLRLLNLADDDTDVAKYADVATATLYYMQSQQESWKQFAEPSQTNLTISKTMLKQQYQKAVGIQTMYLSNFTYF